MRREGIKGERCQYWSIGHTNTNRTVMENGYIFPVSTTLHQEEKLGLTRLLWPRKRNNGLAVSKEGT